MRTAFLLTLSAVLLVGLIGCSGEKESPQPAPPAGGEPGGGPPAPPDAPTPPETPGTPETPAAEALNDLDPAYIPAECFAAVLVHVSRAGDSAMVKSVLEHPEFAPQLEELQQMGMDPLKIERVIVAVRASETLEAIEEAAPSIILRTTEPGDGKQVLAILRMMISGEEPGELPEVTCAGKTCLQLSESPSVVAHVADDRTILLSDETGMNQMLSAGEAKSPLLDRLRRIDLECDAAVVVALNPIREMIAEPLGEAKQMLEEQMPPLAAAAALPDRIKTLALSLDLSGETLLALTFEGNTEDDAGAVEDVLNGLVETGKAMARQVADGAPPGAEPFTAMGTQAADSLVVTKSGAEVVVSVKRPAGLDEFDAAEVLEMMFAGGGGDAKLAAAEMQDLHELGTAMMMYSTVNNGSFPPGAITDANGKPLLSWRVALMPYLDDQPSADLYKKVPLTEPWDGPNNVHLAKLMYIPPVFASQADREPLEAYRADRAAALADPDLKQRLMSPAKTRFLVFSGEGAPFGGPSGVSHADITDGSSRTIMIVKAPEDRGVPWTKPQDLPMPDASDPEATLFDLFGGPLFAVFFDGHVEELPEDLPVSELKAMITHQGGEVVGAGPDMGFEEGGFKDGEGEFEAEPEVEPFGKPAPFGEGKESAVPEGAAVTPFE